MEKNIYLYIAVMAGVSYLIRVLPLTLIRKPIKNQFIQSFLYYVPYVTLAVMTFPAILSATNSTVSAALALVIGIIAAWCGRSLLSVAVICCAMVFVTEIFLVWQKYIKHIHLIKQKQFRYLIIHRSNDRAAFFTL